MATPERKSARELTLVLLAGRRVRTLRITRARLALFAALWLCLLSGAALLGFASGSSDGAAHSGSSLRADASEPARQ
jgi:hypothetical protein